MILSTFHLFLLFLLWIVCLTFQVKIIILDDVKKKERERQTFCTMSPVFLLSMFQTFTSRSFFLPSRFLSTYFFPLYPSFHVFLEKRKKEISFLETFALKLTQRKEEKSSTSFSSTFFSLSSFIILWEKIRRRMKQEGTVRNGTSYNEMERVKYETCFLQSVNLDEK